MMDKKSGDSNVTKISVTSEGLRNVPKFCNQVTFELKTDNHIVISLIYRWNDEDPGSVIERVIVTKDHAEKMRNILNEILENNKHETPE